MSTPWDPLQRAYFHGEALWTYLTTPFLLAPDGVRVAETETKARGRRDVARAARSESDSPAKVEAQLVAAPIRVVVIAD
jgi:hypothetical protein